jgi:translation initiation factor 3 subunit C
LETLESCKEIVVVEGAEEWEDDDKQPTITEGEVFKIPGSVVSFVERLDDELTRSLQHIDPHTSEYIDRLTDEGSLYASLVRALVYVENLKKMEGLNVPQESVNRVIMRRLEHVYFKVRHLPMPSFFLTYAALPSCHYSREQHLASPPLQR